MMINISHPTRFGVGTQAEQIEGNSSDGCYVALGDDSVIASDFHRWMPPGEWTLPRGDAQFVSLWCPNGGDGEVYAKP